MIYCRECGNSMDSNRRFCTECAAPLDREIDGRVKSRRMEEVSAGLARGQGAGAGVQGPKAEEIPVGSFYEGYEGEPATVEADSPAQGEKIESTAIIARPRRALRGRSAVVTTGGFVGIFMLMLLPPVNLIALIIWALGGCKKIVKQNFARAALLMALIALVLAGVYHMYGNVIEQALRNLKIAESFSGIFNLLKNTFEGINRLLASLDANKAG